MRPVLVTGAAGFVGSHLCESLLDAGHAVHGVDSFTPHYARELKELNLEGPRAHPKFTFHEADLLGAALPELTDQVGWVFHLAARPGVRDSWSDFEDYVHSNVHGTKTLLDACAGRDLRVVFASSSSVYGDAEHLPVTEETRLRPISPYGATKVMTEVLAGAYAQAHGLAVVGLRYFTVYGPRQRPDMGLARFIEAAAQGREIPVYGDGSQLRDFTYVEDVVTATIAAAERGRPGGVYNVASSDPQTLLSVLDELRSASGGELSLRFEEAKLGDVRDTWADTTRAREELGFEPATKLSAGLARQIDEATRRRRALAALAG